MANEAQLPIEIISKADVFRLRRELEGLDNQSQQDRLRQQDGKTPRQISPQLQNYAQLNKLSLDNPEQRKQLIDNLSKLVQVAPVLHISFASNPGGEFLQKLLSWIRKEIHPLVLLQVGLQPSIAAGCTLRTTSKYFDFSLRKELVGKENILFERFHEVNGE